MEVAEKAVKAFFEGYNVNIRTWNQANLDRLIRNFLEAHAALENYRHNKACRKQGKHCTGLPDCFNEGFCMDCMEKKGKKHRDAQGIGQKNAQ